jgi:hypothetical protein
MAPARAARFKGLVSKDACQNIASTALTTLEQGKRRAVTALKMVS